LTLENLSESFLNLLKFIFLLVGNQTYTIGRCCITINMSGTEGKTKVNQCWIDHKPTIDSVQQVMKITEMPKTSAHAVSIVRKQTDVQVDCKQN